MLIKQLKSLQVSLETSGSEHEITFRNTANPEVAPDQAQTTDKPSSWFSYFKGPDFASVQQETDDEELCLGYVQLFGYIVKNYEFEVSGSGVAGDTVNSDTVETGHLADVWDSKDYINLYRDFEKEESDGVVEKLPTIPLLHEKKLSVNGKIGGVILESEPIFDLIYPFNARDTIVSINSKETSDCVVPFYSTSQSLLFSEIKLKPGESESFKLTLPINKDLPPSYNTRSTGPACDQGFVSIRYSIVVGYSVQKEHKMVPKCIYFPVSVSPRAKEYVINPYIDQEWKVNPVQKTNYSKESFMSDLTKLIDADLHNLPRMTASTEEPEDEIVLGTTQFQLRFEENQLCLIVLSKSYYHIGEDVNFSVDINPVDFAGDTRVVGYTVYVEAHEVYHNGKEEFSNIYKCTPDAKFNSFGASLLSKNIQSPLVQSGSIHLPQYLTAPFKIKNFITLKYFLSFTFNLLELTSGPTWEEVKEHRVGSTGTEVKLKLPITIKP